MWARGEPACLMKGDNNRNKKSNDEDGKRNAGEDLWYFAYDDGDQEDYDEAELREGQRPFLE